MEKQQRKKKRNRGLIVFLFPALILVAIIGWCMYVVDIGRNPFSKKQRKFAKKDNVTLLPIIGETQELEAKQKSKL